MSSAVFRLVRAHDGGGKRRATKIRPKAVGAGIFDILSELKCDVISGADVQQVGVDALVKLRDSRSNYSRDIRLSHFVTDEQRRRRSK